MKNIAFLSCTVATLVLSSCSSNDDTVSEQSLETADTTADQLDTGATTDTTTDTESVVTFQMDAWADNWFAAYLGDTLLIEDSVSIDTERSFNSESIVFEATYPLQLNFILKDYKENDTGLEYIGENNQQMGDGGFIMQLSDTSTGNTIAVTSSDIACTVIHEAPLDKSCENEANPTAGTPPCDFISSSEPLDWKSTDFNQSAWTATTVHTAAAVAPKDGYNDISWDSDAEFIWGPDLETDNTLLCRLTISDTKHH